MIVETSRPSRASRLRRPRRSWWQVVAIAVLIFGIGAAALVIAHQ